MPPLVQSRLLSSIEGLQHGFLTNHSPGAREAHDAASPGIATVNQVHKDQLLWTDVVEKRARDADALATSRPNLPVGVYSADCTPILMAALDASDRPLAVMAVHAGWRGTAALIAEKAFAAFHGRAAAARYVAVIGPCISFASFEVGEEVVAAFAGSLERGLAKFLREEEGQKKFLFDLAGENRRQLEACAKQHRLSLEIEVLPRCTFREKDTFPSYRRDRGQAGRLLSYVSFA